MCLFIVLRCLYILFSRSSNTFKMLLIRIFFFSFFFRMRYDEKSAEIVNFFVRSAISSFFSSSYSRTKKIAFYSLLLWIYSYGQNANVFVSESMYLEEWHELARRLLLCEDWFFALARKEFVVSWRFHYLRRIFEPLAKPTMHYSYGDKSKIFH